MEQELKVGKKLSPHEDYSGGEVEDAGWIRIDVDPLFDDVTYEEELALWDELLDWIKTNADLVNDIRFHYMLCIFFRLEQDAMAFKLRWL